MHSHRAARHPDSSLSALSQPRLHKRLLVSAIALGLLALGTSVVEQAAAAPTCTWNTTSGNWSSAANWSTCNSTFPGSSTGAGLDAVVTDGSVTIDSSGLSVGALTVDSIGSTGSSVEASGTSATNDSFTSITIDLYSTFGLDSGAQITSGTVTVNSIGSLSVDASGAGGSMLTVNGALNNGGSLQVGNSGMSQASLVKVNGSFINAGGGTYISGGSTAAGTAEVVTTSAAPATFEGSLYIQGNTGAAALEYAAGGSGITQIGDGSSNSGYISLTGANAYVELGASNSNSALANLATIASNGNLSLESGASVTTGGSLAIGYGGILYVDYYGAGGSTLTVDGDLNNGSGLNGPNYGAGELIIGNGQLSQATLVKVNGDFINTGGYTAITGGNTAATLVKVNGDFIDTGGYTTITGGSTAAATAELVTTGAAPATFEGTLTIQGNTGAAALEYATGGSGITQIGDGGSNPGYISLTGANAYLELGASNSNNALANLATIANGSLYLDDGASVTTSGSLTNEGSLSVGYSYGGSTLTVNGDLNNGGTLEVGSSGITQAALVKVNGDFIDTGGYTYITGGSTASATAEVLATGAAPATFEGTLNITGGTGAAALEYGTGGSGIIQIGDGASNPGSITLSANAYVELGASNSNSALANLATIAGNGTLNLSSGASLTTSSSLAIAYGGALYVDSYSGASAGGSMLTVHGSLNNGGELAVGNGSTSQASLVNVNGNFINTGGTTSIEGGSTAAGTAEVVTTGAAPGTFEGYLGIDGRTGAAALEYAAGGSGITQIGDGASNAGEINLYGANAYLELGASNSNSALANLATIAANGALSLDNIASAAGASVTTSGALTNAGSLTVMDGSTLTVNGDLNNGGYLEVTSGGASQALVKVNGNFINTGDYTTIYGGSSSASGTITAGSGATNSGNIAIDAYGNLDVTGGNAYTQTAGQTGIAANGNLSAANVALNGGLLQGDGTVTGNVYNGAVVEGGAVESSETGTLTINGNFINSGTGELGSPFGNATAGTVVSYLNTDGTQQITVSGAVTLLGGAIQGNAGGGFTYAAGQSGTVMNFAPGHLTGVFAGVQNGNGGTVTPGTSTDLGNGLTLGVVYNNQQGNIQLVVVNTPGTTTETWKGGTGNWSTAGGWGSGAAPQFYSDVTIGSTSSGTVTLGQGTAVQDATVESLAITNGNSLAYQATTPTSLSVGSTVTVDAGATLSLPTSGDQLELGGDFSNAGSTTLGAGAALATLGTFTNTGTTTAGNGASIVAYGGPTSVAASNSGTLSLAGASLTAPGLTNTGTVVGSGSIDMTDTDIANSGVVEAKGGMLTVKGGGVQGSTGTITIDGGATLDLSHSTAGSTAAALAQNGSLALGANNVTVSSDYDNANFGTGNSFNKTAGVTGTGQILASGNIAQDVTGANVTNGTTANPTLAFGNVHVGSTNSAAYAIGNTGPSGPSLRGAIQTSVSGGNITDASLSGTGVTAGNWGPVSTGASTSAYTVTYAPTQAGALSGQAVHIVNNFGNVAEQTLTITGVAYAYASPTVTSSLSPQYNFGVVQVGQTYTDPLKITNTLTASNAAYQEGLNASFGTSNNSQLSGSGSITNLGAGKSDSSDMVVTLKPTSAGAIGGTVTVDFASNGATTSGLGITNLASQDLDYTWSFSSTVVNQAKPSITPSPINLGNVRINSTANQALSVENIATTAPQASLDAQMGSATGAATLVNATPINQLAPGNTDNTSFVVGMSTATAGAQSGSVNIALQSDSTPNGCTSNCIVNLPNDTVNVSGNVYRLANPTLNTSSVTLAARVGDTAPTANVSVTNTSPDQYTEGLAASPGTAPTGFTASGSITNLAAQGTDASSLKVGLNTTTAGAFSGNQTVNFTSNGLIDNATPVSAGSGTVALTGHVYTPAQATVNTASPIDFGIVHVGDGSGTLSKSISVTNSAAVTALNDTLLGSVNASGAPFTGTGSLTAAGLAAQQSSSALGINLSTAAAGIYSGTANLAFKSHDADLSDLALAGASLGLKAQVNNYAALSFSFGGGLGTLTQTGTNSWMVNLGNVTMNSHGGMTSTLLSFLNSGGPAAFTDLLSSSGSITSGSGFSLSGDSVSNLAGNASQGGFGIGLGTSTLGNFNELLSFNVNSSNSSGYDMDIGTVSVDLEGDVVRATVSVPEPGDLEMLLLGLAVLGFLGRAGFRRGKQEEGADGR